MNVRYTFMTNIIIYLKDARSLYDKHILLSPNYHVTIEMAMIRHTETTFKHAPRTKRIVKHFTGRRYTQSKSSDYVHCSSVTANIPWSSTEFSRGHLKQKILAMFIVFMNHILFLLVCFC